jgi:hypothetical protein
VRGITEWGVGRINFWVWIWIWIERIKEEEEEEEEEVTSFQPHQAD